jgi:hypothetical protein
VKKPAWQLQLSKHVPRSSLGSFIAPIVDSLTFNLGDLEADDCFDWLSHMTADSVPVGPVKCATSSLSSNLLESMDLMPALKDVGACRCNSESYSI